MDQKNQNNQHVPVLVGEVLEYLRPKGGESFLDLTAGYGGHASAILERTLDGSKAVLVDRDQDAISILEKLFGDSGVQIIHENFLDASKELKTLGKKFDNILVDLGVSSPHLDNASRGFAFNTEGPLDMRMDQRQTVTAEAIVNGYSEAMLVDILRRYGEEPQATKIARSIVENRPVRTTTQLAAIVARASKPGWTKTHPATRTFQAIRIVVNDELDQIQSALPIWIDLLAPDGRIAVISFHSLEDRIVKEAFNERSKDKYETTLRLLTKKPVTGHKNEIVLNPRARSAKLRAAAKINNLPTKSFKEV